jgi:hypothetical protein
LATDVLLSSPNTAVALARLRLLLALGAAALFCLLLPDLALAHNCSGPGDCLQTAGFNGALALAGGLTAAGTVLVMTLNGLPTGAPIVIAPPEGPGEGADDEEPRRYTLDARTQDQRTLLLADNEDALWVYARVLCSDPEVDTQSLTAGLDFRPDGPQAAWLLLDPPTLGDFKAVRVRAWPPTPDACLDPANPAATLLISTTIEGQRASMPVELQLDLEYVMEYVSPYA